MGEEKVVKVGLGQLSNPTPLALKYVFRTASFLVGLWAIVQHMEMGIPEDVIPKINEWCVLVLPIIHYAIKFFGLDYKVDNN